VAHVAALVEGSVQVVAGALAVELLRAHVDVSGAVGLDPRLGLNPVAAGIASVTGNSLGHAALSCMLTHDNAVYANTYILTDTVRYKHASLLPSAPPAPPTHPHLNYTQSQIHVRGRTALQTKHPNTFKCILSL